MTTYPANSFGLLQECERLRREVRALKQKVIDLETELSERPAKAVTPPFEARHVGFGRFKVFCGPEVMEPKSGHLDKAEALMVAKRMNDAADKLR